MADSEAAEATPGAVVSEEMSAAPATPSAPSTEPPLTVGEQAAAQEQAQAAAEEVALPDTAVLTGQMDPSQTVTGKLPEIPRGGRSGLNIRSKVRDQIRAARAEQDAQAEAEQQEPG